MCGPTWRRFGMRMLLIVAMLVAASLAGLRTLERRGRFIRNQGQVRAWTGQRNRYQQLAALARSKGDIAGAAKWDDLAVFADGWRRVFEHLASGGSWEDGPPVPKDPQWPPVSKPPQ
jgi:hypothetical protein